MVKSTFPKKTKTIKPVSHTLKLLEFVKKHPLKSRFDLCALRASMAIYRLAKHIYIYKSKETHLSKLTLAPDISTFSVLLDKLSLSQFPDISLEMDETHMHTLLLSVDHSKRVPLRAFFGCRVVCWKAF